MRCRSRPEPGRTGCGERRVLGQDAGLELSQGRARIDAQLVHQAVPDVGVGPQGLGLASISVEGDDEQLPQALAKWVFPAERLQLADDLPVAAQGQVRSDPGLERH